MNVSRYFVLIGTLYLIVGIALGMHMGAANDFTLAPLHAHLNLLGFVLSILFALCYKVFAEMGASGMARLHFGLHAIGATLLLVMIFRLLSGSIDEAGMVPMAPIAEGIVMLGVLTFFVNALKNAR